MYEDTFGTDWTRLDSEDAIQRAFALGVSAACGHDDKRELQRLTAEHSSSYDRSLVVLAYEEGRTSARTHEEANAEAIWNDLVDESMPTHHVHPFPEALPGALSRLPLLRRSEGPPASLDLPGFLKR